MVPVRQPLESTGSPADLLKRRIAFEAVATKPADSGALEALRLGFAEHKGRPGAHPSSQPTGALQRQSGSAGGSPTRAPGEIGNRGCPGSSRTYVRTLVERLGRAN